jgi:hypothetical protein
MVAVIDLKAEFARLKMLKGRTPTTPAAEREGAFARLAPYRDGAIFIAKFAGTSAWERHPQGDEIVQIVLVVRSFRRVKGAWPGTTSDLPSAVRI